MITCDYGGGFGNRLFQYCFARILSEKLKLALKSHPGRDITDVLKLTGQDNNYISYDKIKETINDQFTFDNILKRDFKDYGYHLIGYFQHAEYFLENRDLVKSFFDFKPPVNLDKNNIVAHIRLGDYKNFGHKGNVLHPSYYLNALKRERYNKLYIVTDEPDDKNYFDYFKGINYEIVSQHCNSERKSTRTAKDFFYLMNFDRIIIANSTFSWWAAFLSNASKVYTPRSWIRYMSDAKCNLHRNVNSIAIKSSYIDTPIEQKYKKLSFIVCVNSSRKENLSGCIDNINDKFRDFCREIIIVEQAEKEPFKRGQLFNLGYKESTGDLVIFQDVDIRYMHKIDFNYRMQQTDKPLLPWNSITQLNKTDSGYIVSSSSKRQYGYGAVNVFTREQFEKVNGYSNLYIGWGGEDTEMNWRAKFERLAVSLGHIEHPREASLNIRNTVLAGTCKKRDLEQDGLKQTTYKTVSVVKTCDSFKHLKYTDVDVCEEFKYKDLFETNEQLFITNVRKELNTHLPIGILTHNRATYFKGTIESLNKTLSIDKKKLVIFDDGSTDKDKLEILDRLKNEVKVVSFGRAHKTFKATKKAIEYMYLNNPKDREFILSQDDVKFSKDWYFNALIAIETMYKDGLEWGTLSLYNLRTDIPPCKKYGKIESGHAGAVCLVINREFWKQYRKENDIDGGRECNLADFLLAHWCQTHETRKFAVCVTTKSLVQHMGVKSSLSDRDMSDCVSPYFVE